MGLQQPPGRVSRRHRPAIARARRSREVTMKRVLARLKIVGPVSFLISLIGFWMDASSPLNTETPSNFFVNHPSTDLASFILIWLGLVGLAYTVLLVFVR